MNLPGFTAEASLGRVRPLYRRIKNSGRADWAVHPAQILDGNPCLEFCHEDCFADCGSDLRCLVRCARGCRAACRR